MRIAVAMSGGVDSAVAAALLRDAGHEVIGLTALMAGADSRCCAAQDVEMARAAAARMGIEHRVEDLRERFDAEVVGYFVAEHLRGRTPSPCVVCNRAIKFGALMDRAAALGAERLATGHYARTAGRGDAARLLMGRDRSKDQSYFLAMLSRGQLARAVFPVGDLSKAEVVRIAAERGLAQAGRRESQDICFVPPGGPGDWIGVRSLDAPGAGDMEDCRGMKIGRHRGVHHYTVGQRKGLGVALGRPVYVVRLDAARNVVVVGDRSEAMARRMTVTGASWIAGAPPSAEFRASVRIRYSHPGAGCRAAVQGDGTVAVLFDEPQFAVAPGQLAVFNDGDEVLGGGWISA